MAKEGQHKGQASELGWHAHSVVNRPTLEPATTLVPVTVPERYPLCEGMDMFLTSGGPVTLPDVALPAGGYFFEILEMGTSSTIVRVSNEHGSWVCNVVLAESLDRKAPPAQPGR